MTVRKEGDRAGRFSAAQTQHWTRGATASHKELMYFHISEPLKARNQVGAKGQMAPLRGPFPEPMPDFGVLGIIWYTVI